MSNLELIERLCEIVEDQADVVRCLALSLAECRQMTEAEREMTERVERAYREVLGADEIPDGAERCVCCGAAIPEGRLVCPGCERRG